MRRNGRCYRLENDRRNPALQPCVAASPLQCALQAVASLHNPRIVQRVPCNEGLQLSPLLQSPSLKGGDVATEQRRQRGKSSEDPMKNGPHPRRTGTCDQCPIFYDVGPSGWKQVGDRCGDLSLQPEGG